MPIEIEFQLQIAPRFHGWKLYVIRFELCMKLMKKKDLSSYQLANVNRAKSKRYISEKIKAFRPRPRN